MNGFPVKNALQPDFGGGGTPDGGGDAFVVKLNMAATGDASVVFSTYLGGSAGEEAYGVAVDSAGNAYITGWTTSTDFPIENALQIINASPGVWILVWW